MTPQKMVQQTQSTVTDKGFSFPDDIAISSTRTYDLSEQTAAGETIATAKFKTALGFSIPFGSVKTVEDASYKLNGRTCALSREQALNVTRGMKNWPQPDNSGTYHNVSLVNLLPRKCDPVQLQ